MSASILNIKSLRLRLGWTQSDLSRRLGCTVKDVESWETGQITPDIFVSSEIERLLSQADACAFELQSITRAENICDKKSLGQVDLSTEE